jgi:hypothetical protein
LAVTHEEDGLDPCRGWPRKVVNGGYSRENEEIPRNFASAAFGIARLDVMQCRWWRLKIFTLGFDTGGRDIVMQ